MAVFDITPHILHPVQWEYDPYARTPPHKRRAMVDMRDWLDENVGEYYGPGDNEVCHIGSGWEIFKMYNKKREEPNPDMDTEITWHVDITDEAKSVLFALKWIN